MSKFKKGDKVVPVPDGDVDQYFKDRKFYVVTGVVDDLILVTDDGGHNVDWYEWRFEMYNEPSSKEAANAIAPSGLVQSYIPLIEQWGRDRGILDNSTPLGQSRKTVEEVRELVEAAAKMQAFIELAEGDIDHRFDSYEAELADAIGDIFVTLVMVAGCAKLDINACVAQAYETIKDRKGYLRPDGVFVKEEQV